MGAGTEVMSSKRYYRSFDIWALEEPGVVVSYKCFEVLPINKYCVQSIDRYRTPIRDADVMLLARNFLELLADSPPETRSGLHDTIEEAIRSYEAYMT